MRDNRTLFRKNLNEVYLPYYDALCKELPIYWQPISGFRTMEEQAKLYAAGRTYAGRIITKADAGMSFHNYGLATDWEHFTKDGHYDPLAFDDPRWEEYHATCRKLRLVVLKWERPHNQHFTNIPISKMLELYKQGGYGLVNKLLRGEEYGIRK